MRKVLFLPLHPSESKIQAAADFLKNEKIDLVFSSPLSRALYGAERIAENYGLTPIQDDRFREINRGRWLGLTKEQVIVGTFV